MPRGPPRAIGFHFMPFCAKQQVSSRKKDTYIYILYHIYIVYIYIYIWYNIYIYVYCIIYIIYHAITMQNIVSSIHIKPSIGFNVPTLSRIVCTSMNPCSRFLPNDLSCHWCWPAPFVSEMDESSSFICIYIYNHIHLLNQWVNNGHHTLCLTYHHHYSHKLFIENRSWCLTNHININIG